MNAKEIAAEIRRAWPGATGVALMAAAELDRLAADNEWLRRALMPFANHAAQCEGKHDGFFEVRIIHIREARAAIAPDDGARP